MKKFLVFLITIAFIHCSPRTIEVGGGGSSDETHTAMVYNPDGSPAIGASVKIFEYGTTAIVLKTATDMNGRYKVAGLNGTYSIFSQKDSLAAFQDSAFIFADTNYIKTDTLRRQSSLTAQVGLQPGHNYQTVTAEILGTDIFANVTLDGKFTMSGIAEGTYRLRLSTTLPDYTTTYFPLSIPRGVDTTLTDTLKVIYTGPSFVTGLSAQYDAAQGVMNISWNSMQYQNFQEYLIYRQENKSKVLSVVPFAIVTDTIYRDTIYKNANWNTDTNTYTYQYRIKIRDKFDQEGPVYGFVKATAYPPALVKTNIRFKVLNDQSDTLKLKDTIRIVLELTNKTRNLRSLKWAVGSIDSIIKSIALDSTKKNAIDTLLYILKMDDLLTIYAICEDTYSMDWIDSCKVSKVQLQNTKTVTDIDGNVYTSVTIGAQTWMVENLKTTKYNDGASIPLVTDTSSWGNLATPGYCWFNNDTNYKNPYGALYNWYVVGTGKLAPIGWHVPTDAEWDTLITYVGGASVAGGKLKEMGLIHWITPNSSATNEVGFTALPGAYRSPDGVFLNHELNSNGWWWPSTEYDSQKSNCYLMYYDRVDVLIGPNSKKFGFSIRCVRD